MDGRSKGSDYSMGRLSFFFRAGDGIRDTSVTGVQTCALPIFFVQRYIGMTSSRSRRLILVTAEARFVCPFPIPKSANKPAYRLPLYPDPFRKTRLSRDEIGRASRRERV